jgi:hypothetical protein
MNARTRPRTASSKGSNHSLPANGDGGDGKAGVASFMAWVPSRSCRSEPTPPQPISTTFATRPIAPSIVVPKEWNAMLNPAHLRMADVTIVASEPFRLDPRLATR